MPSHVNTAEVIAAANMASPRRNHTSTMLPDGTVLQVGGANRAASSGANRSCVIYNPTNATFSRVAELRVSRHSHTATMLNGGHVLIEGGQNADGPVTTSEYWNPVARSWSASLVLNNTPGPGHSTRNDECNCGTHREQRAVTETARQRQEAAEVARGAAEAARIEAARPRRLCPSCRNQQYTDGFCSSGHCGSCCRGANRTQTCSVCHAHNCAAPRCAGCNACQTCCECSTCRAGCSHFYECDVCRRCSRCCQCTGETGEAIRALRRGYGTPWVANKADRIEFNSTRMTGVEWEYNRATKPGHIAKWMRKWRGKVITDGSCGMEVVSAPMAGDHIKKALTELGTAFSEANATADQRCGIHVHVDTSDLMWTDMCRLLTVYARIEPLLYLLAGQERCQNQFSRTCGEDYKKALLSEDWKGSILAVAFGHTSNKNEVAARAHVKSATKKDGGRYRGLNICPWLAGRKLKAPDTTVEFRIHQGTLDANRVAGWARLCASIIDWVAKSSDKDVAKLPKSALQILCKHIAPDMKPWIIGRINEWRKMTKRGSLTKKLVHFRGGKCAF